MMTFCRLRVALLIAAATILPMTGSAQIAAPSPPALNAKGYLLVDFNSGRVLASKNADERLEPASITKLMTAYAVFRAINSGQVNLDDEVRVSEKAWRTPGSRMFIEVGTRVPVELLLPGMIVQSGNDASVALAEHVAGTEASFAEIMNQLADELGMTRTNYLNSTGLPAENHYTSASDIAALAAALIREYPDYYKWYSQKEFTYNGITQGNRNGLLWRDETVDGMKTGYTENAGYCLVSSAERNGMRLIAVVLGTKSTAARANESQALLNYGFRFFETHRLWDQGEVVADARVWKGEQESTDLVVDKPVYITIPRGSLDQVKTSVSIPDKLIAPVQTSEAVGEVRAVVGADTVARHNVYSSAKVGEGSLLQTTWDEVLLWFE
ncbi:MAG: serine-type D-Ala-D-Ala carboxypeptidase [Chromatiales bacterium]|jgi:D-alanyl-D-alanine carboxypeptidase (penicillin-binding protein 5/6)|nr:serine-type D-Ala-D-Ala carboxypeptidase [Chromatiales bacterium]MDP6151719.1 D-alanyl-D-alanine carboxypeptidase family protein [Gammaproteobacteria bacterium]MDP7093772.1 D-alanyl-D-alanine carboxypeptidase family protein [Gammaproteobacteria bacterium]MDP7271686.1 D-alanyl-D-alanine carboxypeptidase family protein [Gammaproteobacteria bacterium]HJP03459.1 D-alanyl-D-alanine carboxypeptidase family protein [Gammaproteobacteria bacterium]